MTNFDEQTDLALLGTQSVTRKWQSNSPRFWLLLTAGSIVLHLLLIYGVSFSRLYAQLNAPQQSGVTPIDFVKLPSSKASASNKPTIAKSSTRLASQPSQPEVAKSAKAVQPSQPSVPSNSSLTRSAANSNISVAQPIPEASAVSTANSAPKFSQESSQEPSEPEASPSGNSAQDAPILPSPVLPADASDSASQSAQQPNDAEQPLEPTIPASTPLPSVTPSPLIATMPIDVPVPDVSGTLPVAESSPDRSVDSSPVTNQVALPSQLTASLTTSSLPTKDTKLLDEVAEPTTEVQTFSANSTVSPCPVTPEVVQFLGETVAMQVATDESGNVVQTVTREPSQSPAYDDLATCLVKNWEFTPAIAQGEPVANDGLVVRITIDRS